MDFFLHKVAVLTFFSRGCVPTDGMNMGLDFFPIQGKKCHIIFGYDRHLTRFEKNHLAGVFENRRDIRCHEIFIFTHPNHNPAGIADAGGYDFIRLTRRDHHHTMRAADIAKRQPGSFDQVIDLGILFFDEVDDDLRIGIRIEYDSLRSQFFFQFEKILDDAVVD